MLESPSIRCYCASSDNASGADNQQERPIAETREESSETIRRTFTCVLDEEMVPSAWRHAGIASQGRLSTRSLIEQGRQRNSLSGKPQLAPERSDPFLAIRLISVKPTRTSRKVHGQYRGKS